MKILVVSQHYWPESFRIVDICETLVKLGNDVTVLCGLPNYPSGYIFDGYKKKKNRKQTHNGVNIIRAKEIGRRRGIFFRMLNYWSYPHFASKIVNKLDKDFDFVFVNGLSPIMSAYPAIKYGNRYNKKIFMYEMDLWPESLLAGGIKKDGPIYNHYKKISAKIYSKCDRIFVSTKEHIDYIKKLPNCDKLDINYLPQYAEEIFENYSQNKDDDGVIDLMFAGNIGKAQSLETIIYAAELLKNDNSFRFHIVGEGSSFNEIKILSDSLGLKNVIFYGTRPLEEMPSLYKKADAMLVTLENKPYANMTIPGKIQSYMAFGKPIIGSINGSCASLINENKIGYVCNAGDYNALSHIIVNLNKNDLDIIGNLAKKIYREEFSKKIFFSKLIKSFREGLDDEKFEKQ